MGELAHFVDRGSAKLEASILGMIQTVLTDVVTPLSATIDGLAARIAVCECGQGATEEVTALKSAIDALRSDVDQLKSTYMSMIFGMLEIQDVIEMPPSTTGEEVRVEETTDPESEVETGEEMLEVVEEASYEGPTDMEEAM
ncbi:uncharacterized protein LOC125828849 [Solanum verrucosum]|uniref:uncharacterized protein LOC125828849 n=1 Tax=Solanum verrucosum TaxID=315347 RepID=UPI0020D03AFC|nr:uncharacterized protein LOC125828849 [Solanum verrucosum]